MAHSRARVFASLIPAAGAVSGDVNEPELKRDVQAGCSGCRRRAGGGRQVEVTGSAEVCVPPDRAALTVSVCSSKESAKDAADSVQRRLDYILHTGRQHGLREEDISVIKHLQREEELYHMQAEVIMVFSEFVKMESVRSVLIEKLDRSVCVGDARFSHSSESLSVLRRVCAAAVENARLKAHEVCNLLGQGLGRPLLVREEESREWKSGQQEGVASTQTLQERVGQVSITASSQVFVTFELRPKNSTRKRL
ncbi:interleukin-1 receptor-associated kinase 1-binding protein 1 homolog isoform 2-T2 [Clarias gariepinus]|uniref:interleukin-1 receptor-associated kinase 1-binding protein 1 homolog isoform X2 n=1 Tax=Clarias gariepinus TaxID=13013 RepID=UPI00234E0347|nr:interleukin-1 receptor-associated kinase 1-binding protein 1 homolog isoform X2 [Clarias gariepinus]